MLRSPRHGRRPREVAAVLVCLSLAAFADTRAYYAALTTLERAGWDVDPHRDGSAEATHPAVLDRRRAVLSLARLGLPAWRFGYVWDGPEVIG